MQIVDIREATAPLRSDIQNAYIDFRQMTCSVVAVVTDVRRDGKPIIGYGFNSNGRYAQGCLLRERFIPRIMTADPASLLSKEGSNLNAEAIWTAAMSNEKPGGHGERSVAMGALDMAVWDAIAKIDDRPLYEVLAERYGNGETNRRVSVYAAGGYYRPEKDVEALQEEIRGYVDRGYSLVKIKIGGTDLPRDVERIEAVLDVVGLPDRLAVDANGRFELDAALQYGEALSQYGLRWFEEPGDPLDFDLYASVAQAYESPLATGENLFSHRDVRNLIRYSSLRADRDVLQFDCALSYGVPEFVRMLKAIDALGWSPRSVIPHGGHLLSIHLAASLGLGGAETYPGVFLPYSSLPDGTEIHDGFISAPSAPGIGFETCTELFSSLKGLVGA